MEELMHNINQDVKGILWKVRQARRLKEMNTIDLK